jgi:UDP-2,3-diacylglucosamine pyrophosphatase LpxH
MIVFNPDRRTVESGSEFKLQLMSDLHIGSAYTQYDLIKRDLERARKENARIAINGDVFDLITPSDKKRFRLKDLPPRLYEAGDNLINEAIRWAAEILGPYADLIDVIGVGNHDDHAAKHHAADPVSALIWVLNERHKTDIQHGGYCGWLNYRFVLRGAERKSYKVQYHHGSGGAAPVTKGMATFHRASAWIQNADCVWRGHTHHRNVDKSVVQELTDHGRIKHREILNVRTGAYMFTYSGQSSADALLRGRRSNYAEDWDSAPLPTGGVLVTLRFENCKPIVATAEL